MEAEAGGAQVGLKAAHQFADLIAGILFELDDEDGAGVALDEKAVFPLFYIILCAFEDEMVDEFAGGGAVVQGKQVGAQRFVDGIEVHAKQPGFLGRQRGKIKLDLGDESKRPFRAGEERGKIEIRSACGKRRGCGEEVERVARVSSFYFFFGEFVANGLLV